MKRLKGMKTQNKKMLVIAVAAICLVAGFGHLNPVTAAAADEELDLFSMGYLNPFDLTVTSEPVRQLSSTSSGTIESGGIGDDSVEALAYPDKIWIPVRPVFRSPCIPSW